VADSESGVLLNEKYPGGTEAHKGKLEVEGFTVIKKGRKYFVKDDQGFLAN
jgi:hypothetical protein